uniref:Uncharacterized protein n=1 Tax=Cacopsylla melanoneura TaxID=428564 RepID=A0A8D8ZMD7_9HEMI
MEIRILRFSKFPHDGYDFQILVKDEFTYVCDFPLFKTEHPGLFITTMKDDRQLFKHKKKIVALDNLLTYVDSKLVYSMRHTKTQVETLYRLFELKRCKLQSDITKNLFTFARLSPEYFAYQYFGSQAILLQLEGKLFTCLNVIQ